MQNILHARLITGFEQDLITRLAVLIREEEDVRLDLFEGRIALLTEGEDTLACAAHDLADAIERAGDDLSWRDITGYWFPRKDESRCRVGESVDYADGFEAQAVANLVGCAITDDCYGNVYRPKENT